MEWNLLINFDGLHGLRIQTELAGLIKITEFHSTNQTSIQLTYGSQFNFSLFV